MTSTDPLVSVILPTHNRAAFLPETLDSLLGQSLAAIEVIVIDDGSTDETPQLLARITDPRLRVVRHPVNLGISAATNTGLSMARAPLCAMSDSDDVSEPDRLAQQRDFLCGDGSVSVLGTALTIVEEGKAPQLNVQPLDDESIKLGLVSGVRHISNPSAMFRTALLRGGVRFDPGVVTCGDYGFWIDCAIAGARFAALPLPLVRYCIHPGNISTADGDGFQRDATRVRARMLSAVFPELPREQLEAAGTLFQYRWPSNLDVVAAMIRAAATMHDSTRFGLGLPGERVRALVRERLAPVLGVFLGSGSVSREQLAMAAAMYPSLAATIAEAG